jgi:autotransporter-associated beta strand protein
VGISQTLQHSAIAGDNATDGGLTKLGAGTVTLGSANTYNGNTTVKAGTLEVVLATLATTSTVSISNGAALKMDFSTTNQVGALVLNGVAQSGGVYNSITSPSFISGSGSLLVQSIASNPTNITFAASGGSLHLSWPSDHLGWILQSKTNLVARNWVDLVGSSSVTSTNIPISTAIPSIFYRLRHP